MHELQTSQGPTVKEISCVAMDLPMREIYDNNKKYSNARLNDAGQNVKTNESGYPALVRVNKSIITPAHDDTGSEAWRVVCRGWRYSSYSSAVEWSIWRIGNCCQSCGRGDGMQNHPSHCVRKSEVLIILPAKATIPSARATLLLHHAR